MSRSPATGENRLREVIATRLGAWWQDEWWRDDQYVRAYKDKATPDEVTDKIRRVATVFDFAWAAEARPHPIEFSLLAKGLWPLDLLFGLGSDLISVEGANRLRSVEDLLRRASHYASARLQLGVGALLRRAGYLIEFEPPLPNGRRADLAVSNSLGSDRVYLEIKSLEEPRGEAARSQLTHAVLNSVLDLLNQLPSRDIKPFDIQMCSSVVELLGADDETDRAVITSATDQIVTAISDQLARSDSFDCEVPSVALIRFGDHVDRPGSVSCPITSAESELKRVLRKHIQEAPRQLHPDYPGVIVVKTGVPVDEHQTRLVIGQLLCHKGSEAAHVCGVVFLPAKLGSLDGRPFVVPNPAARVRVEEVSALRHLAVV